MKEEAIHKDWFSIILDHSPESIMALKAVRDRNGNISDLEILFSNKKALLTIGKPDLAGKFFTKEFPGAKKTGVFDLYAIVIETGDAWSGEIHYDEDGFNRWAYLSVAKMDDGCIVSFTDITDRKRAEQKMREQSYFIEQLTAMAPDMITVVELPSRKLIYSNAQNLAAHGFDLEPEQPPDEEKNNLAHPDDREAVKDYWESFKTLSDDEITSVEYRANVNTRGWVWLRARGKVFERDENGTVKTILNSIQDITDRKYAELKVEQLNKALLLNNKALESANSEIKMFSNIAANNYSETLRHLYTNLEHIVSQDARRLSDSGRANLRRAQSVIQKMRLLTDDLMAFTKLRETDEKRQHVDLDAMLQAVTGEFSEQLEMFQLDVQCEQMAVSGYPFLVRLLIHHLVDNAIKFRREDPPNIIQISCAHYAKDDALKIPAAQDKMQYHVLKIIDNGIGFPKEETERIFEIFHRVNEKRYKGSGVGLAICRKVMDLHGGFILADSEPGKDTSFQAYFPVA